MQDIILIGIKTGSFWVSGPIIPSFHQIEKGKKYKIRKDKWESAKNELKDYLKPIQ